MNYAASFYELCFRDLIRDIVRRFPDDSEDTLGSELEFIRKRLEDKGVGSLFGSILNKDTYFQWLETNRVGTNEDVKSKSCIGEVDFSSIREKGKDTKDIVWLLTMSKAKYPRGEDEEGQEKDRINYKRFEQLLSEIGFSNGEDQIFYYKKDTFYFNGLVDNGDLIYRLKQDSIVSDCKGFMVPKDKGLFERALKESNLHMMHGNLKEMLKLYMKSQKRKSIQEIDAQIAIQMAEYLSDLVPVIDRNSKLKDFEQLQKERITVRFAVLTNFLLNGKNINGKLEKDDLKNILEKYVENIMIGKTLIEDLCNRANFNEEQILVITESYLGLLERNLELFKDKIAQFQGICAGLQDKPYPIQLYCDMWKKVCSDSSGN